MAYFKPIIPNNYKHLFDGPNLRRFDQKGFRPQIKKLAMTKEFELANKIIKKGIFKYATPQFADEIINGFRRSNGDGEAAEINFLQADLPYKKIVKDEHYLKAINVCKELFRPHRKLRPVAFPDLRYYPWTLPTSAEAPYTFKKKYKEQASEMHRQEINQNASLNFHNFYNQIFEKNRHLIHLIKTKDRKFWTNDGEPIPYYWHSLHTRAHIVKSYEPDKNRAVFGTPKLLLMSENMFIWPLMKCYLNKDIANPLLWGYETFKGGWNRLWRDIYQKSKPNTFIGIDWSGFDRRSRFDIIDDVHNIWREYFTFSEGYEPTNQFPTIRDREKLKEVENKLENLWKWTTHCIKFTPIRAESGNMYQFLHSGIASGLQETQILDSFVNTVVTLTCLSALGINIESKDFIYYVQGDDSLICIPELIYHIHGEEFLKQLADEAESRFGFKMNVEKSKISNSLNDIDVLAYSNRFGYATKSSSQLLAQLLYPERTFRGLGATASAAVGIAMASMGNDPILYKICYDIWNHIVNDLKIEPKFILLSRYFTYIAQELGISGKEFPSLEKLRDQQQYWGKERMYDQNQKLWPTENKYGFYFLNN